MMTKTLHFRVLQQLIAPLLMALATLTCITACSPKYNWREVHGKDASFVALFPAKPETMSRTINLGVEQVTMTMTAAEIDGVNFAVGTATLADASHAPVAIVAMKKALLRNINSDPPPPDFDQMQGDMLNASGSGVHNGKPELLLLSGRFASRDKQVYQIIVLGPKQAVDKEQVRTFLDSFKLL